MPTFMKLGVLRLTRLCIVWNFHGNIREYFYILIVTIYRYRISLTSLMHELLISNRNVNRKFT